MDTYNITFKAWDINENYEIHCMQVFAFSLEGAEIVFWRIWEDEDVLIQSIKKAY